MATEPMEGLLVLDRLKDHYKHCIRLSASNKINPKNAFDLQLIDYMQDLVSASEDGQMNFKIASSALDVGAKIYSNRVDCIQSEAQKVASSILVALDNQKGNQNSDDRNDDQNQGDTSNADGAFNDSGMDDEGQNKGVKKKRPNRKNIKTLADDSSLDAKLEKMVLGDPFLDGLSKDYDMSCPAALICYNALTQPSGLLTIESNNFMKDYRDSAEPYPGISCGNHITLITKNTNCAQIIRNSSHLKICPRLDNFLFNDRTTKLSGMDTTLVPVDVPDERIDINAQKNGGEHEFDPNMYDNGANNYSGDGDNFADADSVMGDDFRAGDRQENLIPNLDQIGASNPTDYGYSTEHHRLMNTWAGPHAWKAVKVPKTAKKEAPKSARKRMKLEQKPVDFFEDLLLEKEKIADKDTRHSSDVIRRWKKPLLPQDHNLNEDSIRSTLVHAFMRPEDTYHCAKSPADAFKLVGKDHNYPKGDGQANAFNDSFAEAISPGMAGFDDVNDDSDDEFRADPVVEGNEVAIYGAPINISLNEQADLEFAGENLIEQPYTVAQMNIPFAKIAKKMDVRRLKRVMWDLLLPPERRLELTNANITVIENVNKETNERQVNGQDSDKTMTMGGDTVEGNCQNGNTVQTNISPVPSESSVHLNFSRLYGELPVRVSSKMANDLSQPIAFVTLLHLANEKTLKLIPNEDLRDFTIEQDETNP